MGPASAPTLALGRRVHFPLTDDPMPDRHTMAPDQIARLVEAVGGVHAAADLLRTSPALIEEVVAGRRSITEREFCQLMIRAAVRGPQRTE